MRWAQVKGRQNLNLHILEDINMIPAKPTLLFYWKVLKESIRRFFNKNGLTQAAAVAYYMVFSWPSILLIILWTADRFYKEVAVREAIFTEIGGLVGEEGAHQLMATVERVNIQEPTWWATTLGVGILLFTATTVLVTMKGALNHIFEVDTTPTEREGFWEIVRDRVISFSLLITLSLILLVSLVVDALITTFGEFAAEWIGDKSVYMVVFDYPLVDIGATTVLYALFFRYLPDIRLQWKDIWFGAMVTAVFFVGGKDLIGLVIGESYAANLYEAAGSVLVLMLWVYYTSAIFLFGATFTYIRSKKSKAIIRGGK